MDNLWKNRKNGKLYKVLNYNVLNCTNEQDGQKMYLYKSLENEELLFVRSEEEFLIKFIKQGD